MVQPRYTIIVLPNAKTGLRKVRISNRFLSYVLISFAVLVLTSVGLMIHFVRQSNELRKVQAENASLRASLTKSQVVAEKLTRKISALTGISMRLKQLAGLQGHGWKTSNSFPVRMGMGGVTMHGTDGGTADKMLILQKRAEDLETSLASLGVYFRKRNAELSAIPSILPAEGFLSSSFGFRKNPFTLEPGDFHEGIDISNEPGTPVVAPANGIVSYVGEKGSYGQVVEIQHDDTISTLYGHLGKTFVKTGQKVKRGEEIALMGNTGNSTGPHLHYEVHMKTQPVNPTSYVLNASK